MTRADRFCFVPTSSALDVGVSAANLTAAYSGSNPGAAPQLAAFVTQEPAAGYSANTEHLLFTRRTAEWLFKTMENQAVTPGCATLLCTANGRQIQGPANVCVAGTTYSLTAVPGASYFWFTTGSLVIQGANDQPTVSVVATGTSGGRVWVSFSSDCTSFSDWVDVSSLEAPQQPGPLVVTSGNGTVCCPRNYFAVAPVPGAASYTWTVTAQNGSYSDGGTGPTPPVWLLGPCSLDLANGESTTVTFEVTATGNCGSLPTVTRSYTRSFTKPTGGPNYPCQQRPASPPPSPFALYPIPANASLRVELVDADSTAAGSWNDDPALTTQMQIVDYYGQTWLTQTAPGRVADLSTLAVPTGLYVLRVQRGARLETTQISIEH